MEITYELFGYDAIMKLNEEELKVIEHEYELLTQVITDLQTQIKETVKNVKNFKLMGRILKEMMK